MFEIAKARAAVFFGNGHAQKAQIAEFAPKIVGKRVLFVDLGGARCDFGLGKGGNGFADRICGLAKIKFQSGKFEKCHGIYPALSTI